MTTRKTPRADERQRHIVSVLEEAFTDLMIADPLAFRSKFRKMAADPGSFYRGTACLFYSDVAAQKDPWADERTSRIWIQGDLHAENFGTYMDGDGVLVFDVNDFDEAYLGHFTWDLRRMAASIALIGWQKALPDDIITELIEIYARSYVEKIHDFVQTERDDVFSLGLDSTDGPVHDVLLTAKLASRIDLLEDFTVIDDYDRRFRDAPGVRQLDKNELHAVMAAFDSYKASIPKGKRSRRLNYAVKDVVGRSGFGIGSAGLPAYNFLIEGWTQALENDIVLSMKQGNVAAPSRVVDDERMADYFDHHGHRTAVSQRSLQARSDPLLGHTALDGVGFVVNELSPYDADLDWAELVEPDQIRSVLGYLGQATAKAHCVSDEDSDDTLVEFQTEEAIADVLGGAKTSAAFVEDMCGFGLDHANQVRADYAVFVNAFRAGGFSEVTPT
ncbi:MAG: DUF2252 domain-containing protein [Geodermatophilaceae bacterium]|nr:DUF2252 domain-containing protein [Geodermatophilaceae bacterium]